MRFNSVSQLYWQVGRAPYFEVSRSGGWGDGLTRFEEVVDVVPDCEQDTRRYGRGDKQSPITIRRGRRSGQARAKILWNDVDVETALSALGEIEDGRNRERMERLVDEGWEDVNVDDVGAWMAGLVVDSPVEELICTWYPNC